MPRRSFSGSDGYNPIDLLQASSDHLSSANVLFSIGDFFNHLGFLDVDLEAPRCLDSAGYLSHLGVELLLKALLLHFSGSFPDEHSLRKLLSALKQNEIPLVLTQEQLETLKELDRLYELRYPNPQNMPSIGSMAWPRIHSLWSAIGERLPAELIVAVQTLDRTKKFGRVLMKKQKEGPPFEGHVVVIGQQKGALK
jgi:hypothetical protein